MFPKVKKFSDFVSDFVAAAQKPSSAPPSFYDDLIYTSDEAKRLLGYILDENSEAVDREPRNSNAYKFITILGLAAPASRQSAASDTMVFDEAGKLIDGAGIRQSLEVARPKQKHGTIMHTFNATALAQDQTSPTAQKNVNYLSRLSGIVREHVTYPSLTALLNATCEGWEKAPMLEQNKPQTRFQTIRTFLNG